MLMMKMTRMIILTERKNIIQKLLMNKGHLNKKLNPRGESLRSQQKAILKKRIER